MLGSVFISYCTADDQCLDPETNDAKRLSSRVKAALVATGHRVFVDRVSIQAGDEWRRKIIRALSSAYAGVALLTRNALERPWVANELSIMSYRREAGEAFKLIPVLLDGTTIEQVAEAQWLSPLALQDLQMLKGGNPDDLPQKIAEAVGPSPVIAPSTLCEELACEIAKSLADPRVTVLVLQQAALELGGPLNAIDIGQGQVELSGRLAEAVIADGLGAVKEAFRILAERLGHDARNLLARIAPLWVQREHALRIVPRGESGVLLKPMKPELRPSGRMLGLHGRRVSSYTGFQYVERAYWPKAYRYTNPVDAQRSRCSLIRVTSTDGDPETIIDEIRNWVRYTTRQDIKMADDWINGTEEPVHVLLTGPPDRALIEHLQATYPRVVYLVDLGPQPLERPPPGIERLPPVDESETANWLCYADMEGMCP